MSEEDQERLEDYLELEHYIDDLQAGHVAHIPAHLLPEQARIYRMALLFHSASQPPEAFVPSTAFTESLLARLNVARDEQEPGVAGEMAQPERSASPEAIQEKSADTHDVQPAVAQERLADTHDVQPQQGAKRVPIRFVPRRSLLRGSLVAAASLLAGAGVGATVEHERDIAEQVSATTTVTPTPTYSTTLPPLVPSTIPTRLHLVTTVAQLGTDAVRFEAGAITGYVIRSADSWSDSDILAMSAACTHMGCLVQWETSDRSFHCPCHGGLFDQSGSPDGKGAIKYLTPLPRLETVIQDGNIYVRVPDINA